MVVSSSTNPEEHGRLFGDFTKGTKEGGGGGARALQHLPPAGQGWAETLKEGDSAPKKGPRRQGEGPPLPPPAPRPAKRQIGQKPHHPGRREGQPRLGSPQNQGSWYRGAATGLVAVRPGASHRQGSRKNQEGTFPRPRSIVRTKLSSEGEGVPRRAHPESRAGTWSSGARPPPRPSSSPARVPSARGAFLLLRSSPEIWGCAPGGAGGQGPLTLSGGGNCS